MKTSLVCLWCWTLLIAIYAENREDGEIERVLEELEERYSDDDDAKDDVHGDRNKRIMWSPWGWWLSQPRTCKDIPRLYSYFVKYENSKPPPSWLPQKCTYTTHLQDTQQIKQRKALNARHLINKSLEENENESNHSINQIEDLRDAVEQQDIDLDKRSVWRYKGGRNKGYHYRHRFRPLLGRHALDD